MAGNPTGLQKQSTQAKWLYSRLSRSLHAACFCNISWICLTSIQSRGFPGYYFY